MPEIEARALELVREIEGQLGQLRSERAQIAAQQRELAQILGLARLFLSVAILGFLAFCLLLCCIGIAGVK